MYRNDMEWMRRQGRLRCHDYLREAERERQFAIARQARGRRSLLAVVRGAIASALPAARRWPGTGESARNGILFRPDELSQRPR